MSEYLEHPTLPPAQHEESDVAPAALLKLLAAFAAMLVSTGLLIWWIYPRTLTDKSIHEPLPAFPEPRLQTSPASDMAAFMAEEMAYLHGVGWIDRSRGTVHIPIEDAMRRVAREGIPDWPQASVAGPTPSPRAASEGAR